LYKITQQYRRAYYIVHSADVAYIKCK